MVVFPNCKINLGLRILDRRQDGFHNLQSVFIPVPLFDALEVVQSPDGQTRFTVTGITLDAKAEDNICMKAYRLLQEKFPKLPALNIHLHKNIPSGAGLGGGSADGAFMLRLLNQKFRLGLETSELLSLALRLGSDCPFFILNNACYSTGRGEIMEPLALDLSHYNLVLVNPGIHINTGWAFGQLSHDRVPLNFPDIIQMPVSEWRDQLVNDFEEPVFNAHPTIGSIKEKLYEAGAVFAAMSGSGSTLFGFFPDTAKPALDFPDHFKLYQISADLAKRVANF